jgi:hypothetical protein
MKTQKTRRETLKLLTIAGFGLMLPACMSDSESDIPSILPAEPILPEIDSAAYKLEQMLNQLEQQLETENVVFLKKDHTDFEEMRTGFNLEQLKKPLIIALCKNTIGVQEATKYANKHDLKIAVKSGGHSFEGFSSNNDGLVINLSLMNTLDLQEDNALMAGPSVLLKDLYDYILPKERVVPTGSCGTVGLAGITLGGGYGFFAREHGLTCDNLIEATLVDGAGEVHVAVEGDDLMWALRGGGNGNFGVVTELKYKTHKAPKDFVRYRLQAYDLDKVRATELACTWFEYSAKLPIVCFSAFVLNGDTLTILITNYGPDAQLIEDMRDTLSALMDKTSIGERKTLTEALPTYYGTQHPIFFKNSSAGYYDDFSTIEGCFDDILEVVLNNRVIYQINTLGGNINSAGFEQDSCYPHRAPGYLCELQSYWKKESQKESRLTAFKDVQNILNNHGIDKQYRNYPNIDFPDWEQAYFGANYKKLQDIKQKYDPNNMVQHGQSVKLAE